ncbi:MAG TPA: glycosyltransferase family 2 protein [Acidimicrobiales bacterium]|jgi:glycosyltransferase involved in cell wall biosynthesis|nr:glycosyltransferase family 2 protein [Nitrospinaceae bacterium]MDP6299132.1 glycosyltransferase family 2 protein [Acidimicrobiales bacterium]HJM28374.1 glycosyltransferase family 2 protein [Acidimicrobiales bacterium]HJM96778.1 glycosyltransferase family 2 protein [Acidimicrobiales bacterium]
MGRQRRELAIVIPVFNEEDSIRLCVETWLKVLSSLKINFELIVIDDGSWDKTPLILKEFQSFEEIQVITKLNEGHGPTILLGYREASEIAEWVFQADSDNEIDPIEFFSFWKLRHGNDAVLGWRTNRDQTIARGIITRIAALTTRILFGSQSKDANIPFRLIHEETLSKVISRIPRDTFAPNVAITGVLYRLGSKVTEIPVRFDSRTHGNPSFKGLGAVAQSCRAMFQVVRLSRKFP